jgi:hypothetical protein
MTFQSADGSSVYDVDVPMVMMPDGSASQGRGVVVDSDYEAMGLIATLTQASNGVISVSTYISEIAAQLTSATPSAKTDILTYIRAKV